MDVEIERNVKMNLEKIHKQIHEACQNSGRSPEEITLIGVTKYASIERAKEAIRAGVINLGENRDHEFLEKYNAIQDKANWHFVGTLQSRKVKNIVNKVSAIHSVERMSIIQQIDRRAKAPVDCFIQVNITGEKSKHGLAKEDVLPFIEEANEFSKARIVGLMTMAPHTDDETTLRNVFRSLATLRDEIKEKGFRHAPCKFLSMGMSNDYKIAIEEGATHIRIGSELVG